MFPKPNGTGIPGAVGLCHHLSFHTKKSPYTQELFLPYRAIYEAIISLLFQSALRQ